MRKWSIVWLVIAALLYSSSPADAAQAQHVEAWPIVSTNSYCGFQKIDASNLGYGRQSARVVTAAKTRPDCQTILKLPYGWLSARLTVECLNPAPLSDILIRTVSPVVGNPANTSTAVIERTNRSWCTKYQKMRVKLRSGYYTYPLGWRYFTIQTGWLAP